MCKALFLSMGLLAALTIGSARAQVEVELNIETSAVLAYEPLMAHVTIRNNTSQAFTLNGDGATAPTLLWDVECANDERVVPSSDAPALPRVEVPAGATSAFVIDLTPRFQMGRPGRYFVRALVEDGDGVARSQLEMVDVVPGLELAQSKVRLPGVLGVERRCSLRHWSREGKDYLFLCVTDYPSGEHYPPLNLGSVVRVIRPTITVDANATLTITHQIDRGQLMVSTVKSVQGGLSLTTQKAVRIQSGQHMKPATLPVK